MREAGRCIHDVHSARVSVTTAASDYSLAGSRSSPAREARVYEFSQRGSFGWALTGATCPVSVVLPAASLLLSSAAYACRSSTASS